MKKIGIITIVDNNNMEIDYRIMQYIKYMEN